MTDYNRVTGLGHKFRKGIRFVYENRKARKVRFYKRLALGIFAGAVTVGVILTTLWT